MKPLISNQLIIALIFIMVILLPSITNAQPIFEEEIIDTPLDGGLSLLVAAGLGYGANKLKRKKSL